VLEFRVRSRVRVKIRARVIDSCGTKRLGTKRLGYEMSRSHFRQRSFPPQLRHTSAAITERTGPITGETF